MTSKKTDSSRRHFLQSMGAVGIGAVVGSAVQLPAAIAETGESFHKVPNRDFGNTGEKVSILALGGNGNPLSLLMMNQAIKWGVTFWDAWDSNRAYGGGIGQKGIGKYFKKFPDDRRKVFLMTKTDDRDPASLTAFLEKALSEMNTNTVDFFVIHSVSSIKSLHDQTRAWVENARAAGKIRYFGVSSHSNMEAVMNGAVELGFVDGVMVTYNFRVMHKTSMKKAVEKCRMAGLAIVAMKTQAKSMWSLPLFGNDSETEITDAFIKKGYTPAQANLKAVWTNPHIAGLTSMMPNMNYFSANVAAALDRIELSAADMGLLKRYSKETRSSYCAGCTHICELAIERKVPIGDVMRCLMYANSYDDRDRAGAIFGGLSKQSLKDMTGIDYTLAEKRCPQKIAIGKIMGKAAEVLTG